MKNQDPWGLESFFLWQLLEDRRIRKPYGLEEENEKDEEEDDDDEDKMEEVY